MWLIIFLIGIYSLHWTSGIEILRGSYNLNISAISGYPKSLLNARCISNSTNALSFCVTATVLDMSDLELQNIAFSALNYLIFVENLNLGNNQLTKLPRQIFSRMTNLRTLSLANNRISWLNMNFSGLNKLERLDLSNNSIKVLKSRNLFDISKSVEIILKGNDLQLLRIKQNESHSKPKLSGFPITSLPLQMLNISGTTPTIPEESPRSDMSPWNFADVSLYKVGLCRSPNGIVESLHLSTKTLCPNDSSHISIDALSRSLHLDYFGLTAFRRNWYKISSNYFSVLTLDQNRIREIPSELLNDLPESILHITLVKNSIAIIRKDMIVNKFMKSLCLNENYITTIEDGAFKNTNLYELDLSRNSLENLDFARSLPTSIKSLLVGFNVIRSITEGSLANLTHLEFINLQVNRLAYLSAGTFRGLNKLRTISLSFNKLKTIESGTFHQENLSNLDLSFNRIVELNNGIFKDLKKISKLSLSYNRIKRISCDTFSGMRDSIITQIYLESNEIETIEEGSFAHMTIRTLRLDYNQLSTGSIAKGAFDSCRLANLYLDRNSFTSINGDSFYGILIYNTLSLQNNRIETIRKSDAKYMGCPLRIRLNGNGVKRIENGAFYEFQKCQYMTIKFKGVDLIQAGVFNDTNGTQQILREKS